MGCHPDIQEKVIQELDEIFGDSDRPATFQDTLEMKYLERCLMETLRMYPPVPIIARQIKTDLKLGEYQGIFLPLRAHDQFFFFLKRKNLKTKNNKLMYFTVNKSMY